jgi:hypothetical protein
MSQVPLFDEFMPTESLHPIGGSSSGSTFTLAIAALSALAGTSSPDKHYITSTPHECPVLKEPKHRNSGI